MSIRSEDWLEQLRWNPQGLVPAIIQDHSSGKVLMQAWMNRESLKQSLELGQTVFWSRSRQCLWHKGESSGHIQHIQEIRLDCDADALLIRVRQVGGSACHTGKESCFFRHWRDGAWRDIDSDDNAVPDAAGRE